jgi:hypothetical protein
MWVWRAMAWPSRLRVLSHLSHERSEAEAPVFLATCKARTAGWAPFFTSAQLPAYGAALLANYRTPEPPPRPRGLGHPRTEPKRVVDPHLRYAQVAKRRVGGRVVEGKRHILFGSADDILQVVATDRCGTQSNTAYVERANVTSRHSNGHLVRKTLSHSKKKASLQRHIDLEAAIYHFVRPYSALKVTLRHPAAHGRLWQQRTPAMAAGLTDHIWHLEALLSYCLPPPRG